MPHLHKYLTTSQHGIGCCPKQANPPCIVEPRRKKTIDFICYSQWLPDVRLRAPHLPDNILLDLIRAACIEFAQKSKILKRDIVMETQACVPDYWPCLGVDEVIQQVDCLTYDGECMPSEGGCCEWHTAGHGFWFSPPNCLDIDPSPKDGHTIVLSVTAAPSSGSSQVDRIIFERHHEAITGHAVANAMLIPAAPDSGMEVKSSPGIVAYHLDKFKTEINRAKIEQVEHYSRDLKTWRRCGGL